MQRGAVVDFWILLQCILGLSSWLEMEILCVPIYLYNMKENMLLFPLRGNVFVNEDVASYRFSLVRGDPYMCTM